MRLITIAIHTYPFAVELKKTLADAGIEATLQNVNLEHPTVTPGVRVRIHECDLANALRVIETSASIGYAGSAQSAGTPARVLIPTDFSPYSDKACRIGLSISAAHSACAMLLHAYITPSMLAPAPLSDSLDFGLADNMIGDAGADLEAEKLMHAFGKSLDKRMESSDVPRTVFEMQVREGVPEEAIASAAKDMSPMIIVMGTRTAAKKEQELIGSVTAEVLDSVRCPVLSIPETSHISDTSDVRRILFFAMPDQQDILAIDTLIRVLPLTSGAEITIVNAPSRRLSTESGKSLDNLAAYCREHYAAYRFTAREIAASAMDEALTEFHDNHGIDLIVTPTRQRNIFSRLFNPTLAHRLLFRADMPLLAIPV